MHVLCNSEMFLIMHLVFFQSNVQCYNVLDVTCTMLVVMKHILPKMFLKLQPNIHYYQYML